MALTNDLKGKKVTEMARKRGSKRRRRGRFAFLYKILAVLAICAAVITALTMFFRVGEIEVSGNVRYTEDEVRAATGVVMDSNLYMLNKYEIQARILEELPYIETVRINRMLPDRLIVQVTECADTYAVTQGEVAWIFSSSGKIVGREEAAYARLLPQVRGCTLLAPSVGTKLVLEQTDEQTARLESLLALLNAAEESGVMGKISSYDLSQEKVLSMDYAGRFEVQMPYKADYGYLLTYLDVVLAQLESNETGIIDFTVEGEAHVITN